MLRKRAFTLIELLIVVAIIAILAAIAIPNFLEAQVRAKVSRVKADIRTQVTAVEAYYVDHNKYPLPANQAGIQAGSPPPAGKSSGKIAYPYGEAYFETKCSILLTTPIAYITSRPFDVFLDFESDHDYALANNNRIYYHFATRQYAEENDIPLNRVPDGLLNYAKTMGAQPDSAMYYFLSHGPDNFHNGPDEDTLLPCPYDPTNGSVSGGDITYWGPGQGYR
jgi:prepilin-type N-terminal cleavage/methylation domain-containing protein